MDIRELAISGAWVFTPRAFRDDRGVFLEWYREQSVTSAVGHRLNLAQANHSVSRRGTLRGIHYADVPPSQAKYVYCPRGAVLDVVMDIRTGSPTFGQHEAVLLDEVDRRTVYIGEGLGHAFFSLQDASAVAYLCSTPHSPAREHEVNPLDPAIGIAWPADVEPLLSPKDAAAPSLAAAAADGLLPAYEDCLRYYAQLSGAEAATVG